LRQILERLQGLALPAEVWEQSVLPSRVADYQGRWLDDLTLSGEWVWQLSADGLLAFWRREEVPHERAPTPTASLSPQAEQLREYLARAGAAFVVDLVAATGFSPAAIRTGLWELARAGLVSNDRFDVVRRGPEPEENVALPARQPTLAALRRRRVVRPEGRWSLIPWGEPETEPLALRHAARLLERFGVVTRELARQDDSLLPWRVLYEVYSRWELTGEVVRGYFVAGLAGAQFALPEALTLLQSERSLSLDDEPAILLHSCDPANLWGSAAPLGSRLSTTVDDPSAESAVEFSVRRRPRNWLVVRGGKPVLLIEQNGRRLSTWPDATSADIEAAVQVLGEILRTGHGLQLRGKLSVETWNGRPVLEVGPARQVLEAAGFVRDYQALALYAVLR
jgi:ATP-dependent Lhr-like helicase